MSRKPEPPVDAGHGTRISTPPVVTRSGTVVPEARTHSLVGHTLQQTYRIVSVLEQGGMGTVYRGEHLRLRRPVAIKVLAQHLTEDPAALHRFQSEAEIISQLHHPHVVHILDFDTTDLGDPYIVMELLSGETLSRRLSRERIMAIRDIAQIVLQTAGGLLMAHAAGIVHRDLKPDNVFLIAMQDRSMFVKLLDFGISKRTAVSARVTGEFELLGTPDYMAPEQVMNTARADHRADQWSLAAIIYEMLAGRIPFYADTIAGTLAKVMHEEPPPLLDLAPGIPEVMVEVINRGLAKNPSDRFPSIVNFAEEFARAAGLIQHSSMAPWVEEHSHVGKRSLTPRLGGMSLAGDVAGAISSTRPDDSTGVDPDSNSRLPVPTVPEGRSTPPAMLQSRSSPPTSTRPESYTPTQTLVSSSPAQSQGSRANSRPPVAPYAADSRVSSRPPAAPRTVSSSPPAGLGANSRLRRSDSPPPSLADIPRESLRPARVPAQESLLPNNLEANSSYGSTLAIPSPPSMGSSPPLAATATRSGRPTPELLAPHEGALLKLRATLDEIRQAVAFGEEHRALSKARLAVQIAQDTRHGAAQDLLTNAAELLQPILLRSLGGRDRRVSLGRVESSTSNTMSPERVFLLSRVDGTTTIDELLDVSPLSTPETLGMLLDFRDQGFLGFE